MARIEIAPHIAIDDAELEERFIHASGPGGQNVNKVATAVQLRFDAARSPSLPDDVRQRLLALCGQRLTRDGVLVILARRHRSQERNRADARERLAALIRQAVPSPRPRRPTAPTAADRRKRVAEKVARGLLKKTRARPSLD